MEFWASFILRAFLFIASNWRDFWAVKMVIRGWRMRNPAKRIEKKRPLYFDNGAWKHLNSKWKPIYKRGNSYILCL